MECHYRNPLSNMPYLNNMWRVIALINAGVIISSFSVGQVKKQFSIEENARFEKMDMKFATKSGVCFIKPSQHNVPLSIYSNQDFDDYEHTFNKKITNNICFVDLSLKDKNSDNLSKSISYQMFSNSDKKIEKSWKIYLSQSTPYRLDLNYGMGDAYIDLSGLSIENLKVNSGNADVNIGFMSELGNQIEMDTFFVKVDLGSVNVKQMALTNARTVMADIGFGNMFLDYSDQSTGGCNINASVGAGNLIVIIPTNNVPVKVKINDSMLCRVRLTKSFREIENNTFVNHSYTSDTKDVLAFDVDVSLGTIVFKEIK